MLQVWRGYNGHVYFSPIQVQPLESDRVLPLTRSVQSNIGESLPIIRQTTTERSNTISSAYKPRRSTVRKTNQRINHERLSIKKRATTNATITTSNIELQNQTSTTLIDENRIREESNRMWQSVVTCAHIRVKPISKRSQNAIDDLQTLQQEQTLQDPTGYNRQVLPNIRPVPKSKFVYKGLAYKETQRLPGIGNGNDEDDGNTLQKPLVAYNLAQAYARHEINAARAKQNLQKQPPPPTAATRMISKDPQTALQQAHDLREIRRRIVRGTTLAYRPPPQTISWTPGRVDRRSRLGSEVLLPVRGLNTLNQTPLAHEFPPYPHPYITVHTTPNISQIFQIPTAENDTNVS